MYQNKYSILIYRINKRIHNITILILYILMKINIVKFIVVHRHYLLFFPHAMRHIFFYRSLSIQSNFK